MHQDRYKLTQFNITPKLQKCNDRVSPLDFYQQHCTVPFAGGKTHLNTVNKKQCSLTDHYSDCVVCSAQNTELQQCIT